MIKFRMIGGAIAATAIATMAMAGGHGGDPNVKARQSHMQLYAYNLGILGNMAKGEMEYDAAIAQGAADNMVALSGLFQNTYWAPGTDSQSVENSRAKPALWENIPDAIAISTALNEASVALAAVAGTGQAAIGPALGAVGKNCGTCHEKYQESR